MIREIDINHILDHPENCNWMDAKTLSKLLRHIESSGKYEPIIVRPHPFKPGKFQIINGHQRLRALKALEHSVAKCMIWEVDDVQTRLYLATLNRLNGEDTVERRALLIGSLLENFELDDLAELLPENHEQLAAIERLLKVDVDEIVPRPSEKEGDIPKVILEFFLNQEEANDVNLALEVIAHRHPALSRRSQRLVYLARSYLCVKDTNCGVSGALDVKGEVNS